jgi:nitroreductase
MELLEMLQKRRSVRNYTEETIPEEKLNQILQAGLLSPTGKGIRPWEFILIRNKETLRKMAACRAAGAKMLETADAAIVVIGDAQKTDVWTEDCSIAMAYMHLMADTLGVGSCWIQGRLRKAANGKSTEEVLRELLNFPENYCLEAILSLGMAAGHPEQRELSELSDRKIHREEF